MKNSLGFGLEAGNEIGIENGRLNGKIVGPVITKFEKHQILINLAIREGLSIEDTLAIGDGANDLPMLKAAGMGIAYRGKPFVAEQASFRIDYCGLESLLFFQGIHRDQFVE